MPYAVLSTTTYDPPVQASHRMRSFVGTSTGPDFDNVGEDSGGNWTYPTTTRVGTTIISTERSSSQYETIRKTYRTISESPDTGGNGVSSDQTYMNRTFTDKTTTAMFTPITSATKTLPTFNVEATTEVTATSFGRSTSEAEVTTRIWTTVTFDEDEFEDGDPPEGGTYFLRTNVMTTEMVNSFSAFEVTRTIHRSTTIEDSTTSTLDCDTILVFFPLYQKTLYRLPFGTDATNETAQITDMDTLESIAPASSWSSYSYQDRSSIDITGWAVQNLTQDFEGFSPFNITRETLEITRQSTTPFPSGSQRSTAIRTLSGDVTAGVMTFTRLTTSHSIDGDFVAPRVTSTTLREYRTYGRTSETTEASGLFRTNTRSFTTSFRTFYDRTRLLEGSATTTASFSNVFSTQSSTRKYSETRTATDLDSVPAYVSTSLTFPSVGIVSGFGHGAGVPALQTNPAYGLGFAQMPEGWAFAHRCLVYSTVFREEIVNTRHTTRTPSRSDVDYFISTVPARSGTFAPITDGGGTFTTFRASLNENSASFSRRFTVPDGGGSSMSEETTEHVFTNMITDPEIIYKRVYAGHPLNDVSSFVRGAFKYTSKDSEGSTSGTSFNSGEDITVSGGNYFSAKPLRFLTTTPRYPRDSYIEI